VVIKQLLESPADIQLNQENFVSDALQNLFHQVFEGRLIVVESRLLSRELQQSLRSRDRHALVYGLLRSMPVAVLQIQGRELICPQNYAGRC
jgi:hypothetical protein